jgi:hypothetical protein
MRSRRALLATATVVLAASAARAAAAQSEHDIHFLSEHAVESGMDAHYAALPWPGAQLEHGAWRQSVDVSMASTRAELIDLDGSMVGLGATKATGPGRGYELIGFYSEMDVTGTSGRSVLEGYYLNSVPLDLPNPADFTAQRGTLRHFGVGAAYVRDLGSSQLIAGLLVERTDVLGFEMDYRLAGGADAGTTGVYGQSSAATFLTPLVGWQQTRSLSTRWTWSPRALLTLPRPPGDFDYRLTGPGFDLGTPQDGTTRARARAVGARDRPRWRAAVRGHGAHEPPWRRPGVRRARHVAPARAAAAVDLHHSLAASCDR